MTFSIAGRCPETGDIGFAVTTSSVCVGARVGAVAEGCVVFSQARTDPRLHAVGLKAWAETASAQAALNAMHTAAVAPHWRQLGVLPATGDALHLTGDSCLPTVSRSSSSPSSAAPGGSGLPHLVVPGSALAPTRV